MSNEGYIARFEELFRSFDNLSQEINKQHEQNQRDNAEHRQRRAEAARRGELGEDWKTIQERIDNGETTLEDVFSGKDTSEAAETIRKTAQQNVTKVMQQARQEAEENDEEDPFAAFQEKLSALSKATEERVRHFQGF